VGNEVALGLSARGFPHKDIEYTGSVVVYNSENIEINGIIL